MPCVFDSQLDGETMGFFCMLGFAPSASDGRAYPGGVGGGFGGGVWGGVGGGGRGSGAESPPRFCHLIGAHA